MLVLEGSKGPVFTVVCADVSVVHSGGMAAIDVPWDENDIALRARLVVEHRSHGEKV